MQKGAGDTLMESDTVRKIGFTGSTRVGKMLFAAAAETVKKVRPVPPFDSPVTDPSLFICGVAFWADSFTEG